MYTATANITHRHARTQHISGRSHAQSTAQRLVDWHTHFSHSQTQPQMAMRGAPPSKPAAIKYNEISAPSRRNTSTDPNTHSLFHIQPCFSSNIRSGTRWRNDGKPLLLRSPSSSSAVQIHSSTTHPSVYVPSSSSTSSCAHLIRCNAFIAAAAYSRPAAAVAAQIIFTH